LYIKHTFVFLIATLLSLISSAQWYDPEKVNKKVNAINETAYAEAMEGKYAASVAHLDEAIKLDPRFVDGYLSRAGIKANLKNYSGSVTDFETAMHLDSVYSKTFLLPYSISLAGTGNFEKALAAVNEFLTTPKLNEQSVRAGNYRKSTYEFALKQAMKHPAGNYVFAPHNLSDSINSAALEYFPSLTIDGSKMIFTRRVNNDEDFYESNYANGQWSNAKPVGGKINTNLNEGAQNISQDGQLLIFTGCNYPEGEGSCDLYIAYRTKNGGWTEPENMGGLINTDFWESSPSLSPDKKDLYFASSQSGGYGGKDIWVSHRTASGKWGRPVNLGPVINTSGDEGCPFIHADNQTLYFNSNGHPGYGTSDLFLARKNADSSWSEPENLGYPINTIDDEGSLIVASDGKTSYYASERADSKGGLDLYTFELRDDIRAHKTLWVKGQVFDKKTKAGLPSSVELTDVNSGRIVSRLQTDEEGNYLVTLPAGKDYAFNVNRKGYLFYSDNFSLEIAPLDSALVVDIPLQPIEAGASIVLKNIFFNNKEYKLKPESLSELDKVVLLLNDNPRLAIQIAGHTDNVGKDADNLVLSVNRAKSVTAYLLGKGVDAKRLTSKGYGATKPIAPNDTERGKSLNRRTELNVISN
jgi:outer membrane protein OmpA-like peptidoglycan-associated protein/tetratricopeptide (TPR) repeat protein